MAKAKETIFYCSECGNESTKWSGRCPECGQWNTMVEAPAGRTRRDRDGSPKEEARKIKLSTLSDIETGEENRLKINVDEFDRVLGGGIVPGSLVLVSGDPGIGKSTLLIQVCKSLSDGGAEVLYVSGEESLGQIKMRADRIGQFGDSFRLICETDLEVVADILEYNRPRVCVIDSIQTMFSPKASGAPGSVGQIRESTLILLETAKRLGVSIFIVGHVTKEGTVAGPRLLEHMVDTVLYFEGDPKGMYRILRAEKNRFGSTNEIGVFEMQGRGLVEVQNPSEYMLSGRPNRSPGSVVSCVSEGSRQILLEVQALTTKAPYGNPRRSATGVDYGRLNLLLAVLERKAGIPLYEYDVYVNVIGGIRVNETALDLAVVLAVASACQNFVVPQGVVAFGEVGLAGEIRQVQHMGSRINEAARMGFKACLAPKAAAKAFKEYGSSARTDIDVFGVPGVKEAISRVKALTI